MSRFHPVAIVGRGCVLPGALDPASLWRAVVAGTDLVTRAPSGRWGLTPEQSLVRADGDTTDRAWTDRGGYVSGFEEAFDPTGFLVDPAELAGLDPVFLWPLHAARQALGEVSSSKSAGERTGAIFGNLGFPTAGMAEFAQHHWLGGDAGDSRQRFMGSGPADLLTRALGLDAGAYCLDAACASSLYAIKLACDRLARREVDVMLAGAVQASDDLFLHVGFTALQALSRSGQTRPFHAEADGLIPAEGAGFVALKRLEDARADGDTIYGVIRGVGLSNDGRGRGLLAPSEVGQAAAIRAAYEVSGVDPTRVSLLECHATGTPVGDGTEIRSSASVFAGAQNLPIGSLKSNMGHLITAAGVAGVIKVLEAMRHGHRPPTLHASSENAALADSPFRVLHVGEDWPSDGPRYAGVSAFGFGGNNAHILLSEEDPAIEIPSRSTAVVDIVVVGAATVTDGAEDVSLSLRGLKFPPNDLRQALPQQLAMIGAARRAADGIEVDSDRAGVFVGIEPDTEVARYGMRWRLAARELGPTALAEAKDAVVPALTSAAVLGTMPNMPANRLNSQLDYRGPGFVLSAGPHSGATALTLAVEALAAGELDLALSGAVDFGRNAVHEAATGRAGADGCAIVALKRLEDALDDGDAILGFASTFAGECGGAGMFTGPSFHRWVTELSAVDTPAIHVFRGPDRASIAARVRTRASGGEGSACIAVVSTERALDERLNLAASVLDSGATNTPPGVHFQESPVSGELAFVFGGAGAGYPGMGDTLQRAFPSLRSALAKRSERMAARLGRPYEVGDVIDTLWAASSLAQAHHIVVSEFAGVRADAVIGYSSGESNSLIATGTWTDADTLIHESESSGVFDHEIAGEFAALPEEWASSSGWSTWAAVAPVEDIRAAVEQHPLVRLTIVNSDRSAVFAGDATSCAAVVATLGAAKCTRIPYDLAVHMPELSAVAEAWDALHTRAVTPSTERIYSNGFGTAYEPSPERCAEAIRRQAQATLDFRPTIRSAYEDGVRMFVELGPNAGTAAAIRQTLDSDILAVAVDANEYGVFDALAALIAAGVPVDLDRLTARLAEGPTDPPGATLTVPTYARPVDARRHLTPPTQTIAQLAPQSADIVTHENHQFMPPAPAIAATTAHPPALVAPTTQAAAPAHPTVYASAAPQAPTSYLDQLTAIHQTHVAQQSVLQQQFLGVQAEALSTLFSLAGLPLPPRALQPIPTPQPATTPKSVPQPTIHPHPASQKTEGIRQDSAGSHEGATPRAGCGAEPQPAEILSATPPEAELPGLRLSRADLEVHAGGRISTIYGPIFEEQDEFERQVRMPIGRLLLADRVVGLDAEPGTMGKGTIWTETDVEWDSWYLHQARMPAGILIESGQADLMLISYLGVDLLNRGERVYRLLGCELTYHGDLPKAGETLRYDIHLDGHAAHGDVRLMFFHYDCMNGDRPQLSVRGGQAGFFTDEELAASAGCLWTPEEQEIVADAQVDAPRVDAVPSRLSPEQVRAFADGDLAGCFGDAYGFGKAHVRSPRIQSEDMLLIEEITALDPTGGPWGRGYLKGELLLDANRWFYDGHFLNDPCMPGTLMFEGCLQAMAIYVAAMGFTLKRDGWRFQPKPEVPFQLSCRGQATPSSKLLTYELFVEELIEGDTPTLYADLLCTIDGLKAFHARRVALELVPDWPLEAQPELLEGIVDRVPIAEVDGFRFGYASMLACAWGKPSDAFGPMYLPFDGPRKVARLPGPPYHFMTRVTALDGPIGVMKPGAKVTIEYDIPDSAWYFDDNGSPSMPFAVLLEAALQPCGWLASYVGSALTVDGELGFRNLDGKGTLLRELVPTDETLVTHVELTSVSATGGMIIQGFDVRCLVGDEPVYDLQTVFGFFPPAALANQAGLPVADAHRELLERESEFQCVLSERRLPGSRAQIADGMLVMLDEITGFWPNGGAAGLGEARGRKFVDQGEWFFKAHFFQDPVQPGSLGIEAMLQLLQFSMSELGMDEGVPNPRFEPLGLDLEMSWKYRGQVLLHNKIIESTIKITKTGTDERGIYAIADASLWVDGKRIYEASGLGMRIVAGDDGSADKTTTFDPDTQPWLGDHCPTYTRPALPFMSALDLLAADDDIFGLQDVRVYEWLVVDEPLSLRREREGNQVRLLADDGRKLASARVTTAPPDPPVPLAELERGEPVDPYESGALFHGPAFHLASNMRRSNSGATGTLAANNTITGKRLNPGLLDAATHVIPHDALHEWFPEVGEDRVSYPAVVKSFTVYGPTPTTGAVRCEVRPLGLLGSKDLPVFRIQLIHDDAVWAELELVERCFPKGPLGSANGVDRRAFLENHEYRAGVRLSEDTDQTTSLAANTVADSDWFPGTIEAVYSTSDPAEIARRERAASAHGLHPRQVFERLPATRFDFGTTVGTKSVSVSGTRAGILDITPVRDFWTNWFGLGRRWPVEDLYYGLIERFLDRVVVDNPDDFASLRGQSVLYLANHETAVESLIFSIVTSGLTLVPTVTLAKAEHRHTWLGKLIQHSFTYPGVKDPKVMTFFDRADKESLREIIAELGAEMATGGRSVMVHVEGTRALQASHRVQKMTGAFIDMAMKVGVPIVPVRFTSGLPLEKIEKRAEFPAGAPPAGALPLTPRKGLAPLDSPRNPADSFENGGGWVGAGRQSIWIGAAIWPEELGGMHYGARKARVIEGINSLGGGGVVEPRENDAAFEERVGGWVEASGVSFEHAVLREVLAEAEEPCQEVVALLEAGPAGQPADASPWLAELARRLNG